ncbi:MAG: LPXTG cell wall anchor domain-containing protein [Thaumarchaeota archaeon]|nr:LPXTG cell wall anchor domain-containing protein [Nitrososphaerota archaeon]
MSQEYQVTEVQPVLPEGMIFVRINCILTTMVRAPVIAACFLLLALSSFVQYAIGTPKVLDFTIYSEGITHVFYQTDTDPQSPDSILNLYGNSIENLVVQDENGTLLSSKVDGNIATVETLGAATIKADYDTPDLISKNGKTWTFQVNSTVDYSVLLPKNSVIVGMSVSPLNLQTVDDQSLISLPSGSSEINYIIGVLGTSQTATVAIQKAQDFINTINSTGVQTPMALTKLQEARADFNQGKFSDAESLANTAKSLALQEQQTFNSVPNTSSNNFTIYLLIGIIIAASAAGFIIMKRTNSKSRSSNTVTLNETPKNRYVAPDKETIYKLKPELRQDDKDIVAFISEKGGQVFESELRKKFLMPRTTMWRAVKRLEREDVIDIEKVDQQNLIKLKKIEEDNK